MQLQRYATIAMARERLQSRRGVRVFALVASLTALLVSATLSLWQAVGQSLVQPQRDAPATLPALASLQSLRRADWQLLRSLDHQA